MNKLTDTLPLISPRAAHLDELALKLGSVATDLRQLNCSDQVIPRSAVQISHWYISAMPVLTISGIAQDHPKLGTKPITTSQVFYINTETGLARTLNHWYRLGVPMETSPSPSEH